MPPTNPPNRDELNLLLFARNRRGAARFGYFRDANEIGEGDVLHADFMNMDLILELSNKTTAVEGVPARLDWRFGFNG